MIRSVSGKQDVKMMSGAQYLAVTPFFRWFMFPAVIAGLQPVDFPFKMYMRT